MTEHGQNSMQLLNKISLNIISSNKILLYLLRGLYGGLSLADCPPKIKPELGKRK